jgi:glycosyltransferase involved in cell wall biosynthesis
LRILWISTAFYPEVAMGGNVTQSWEECRALSRAGASVTVLTTQLAAGAAEEQRNLRDGIDVHYFGRTLGYWRAFSIGLTRASLRPPRAFDVVHLNSPWQFANPFAALAAARARKPYVISLRGTFMPWALADHWTRKRPYLALIESRVLAGAKAVIASNERENQIARKRWSSSAVVTLPGIVDVERFGRRPSGDVRQRFGIAPDAPLALFIGRNHPVKGLDLLVEGFRRVAVNLPAARLLVAGQEHRGTNADLVARIRAAGLADRVVLAGECGIAPLVAEADAGVVVPVDADAIGDAITAMLADATRRDLSGRRGAAFAYAHFSGDSIARRMLDLYERTISEPG